MGRCRKRAPWDRLTLAPGKMQQNAGDWPANGPRLVPFEEAMPGCFSRQGEERSAAAARKQLKAAGKCNAAARAAHNEKELYSEDGPAMRDVRVWFDEMPTVVFLTGGGVLKGSEGTEYRRHLLATGKAYVPLGEMESLLSGRYDKKVGRGAEDHRSSLERQLLGRPSPDLDDQRTDAIGDWAKWSDPCKLGDLEASENWRMQIGGRKWRTSPSRGGRPREIGVGRPKFRNFDAPGSWGWVMMDGDRHGDGDGDRD